MQKRPYTWNPIGTATSDAVSIQSTDFESWIPTGQTILANASPRWTQRTDTYPFLSGTQLNGGTLTMMVSCLGTIQSQQETLKRYFDLDNPGNKRLVVTDDADSSRQWYVDARPLSFQRVEESATYEVQLALASPVWMAVNETTNATWQISASGQTTDYTISVGNLEVYPVIDITPNSARGAGNQYRRFVNLYNNTAYAAPAYPIEITGGGWDVSAIINDTSVSNHVGAGGITSDTDVVPYDTPVGGGLPSTGMGYISTTGEQISWTGKTGTTSGTLTGVTRGLGGTTGQAATSDAVIGLSHIQADLRDLRIKVGTTLGNAADTNYWTSLTTTSDIVSSTDLKVWISYTFGAKVEGALSAAIGSTDPTLTNSTLNINFATEGGTILIDSERITYTSYNTTTRIFSGLTRGALDSSAASHAKNATIRQIPIIYVYYGDPAGQAQTIDNTQKPLFSLSASSNTSWDFLFFYDEGRSSAGMWRPIVKSSHTPRTSYYYYVAQDGWTSDGGSSDMDALPASNMGIAVQNPGDEAYWIFRPYFGADSITPTGQNTYYLPSGIGLWRVSGDGKTWGQTAITATTPATKAWETKASPGAVSFGTSRRFIQFYAKNRSTSVSYAEAWANIDIGRVVVTLTSATVPTISFGAEVAVQYSADFTIKNTSLSSSDSISVKTDIPFNQTLRIDTLNKTVTALWDNTSRFADFALDTTRDDWLKLQQGTNTLEYTESGASGIDIAVTWQYRNS